MALGVHHDAGMCDDCSALRRAAIDLGGTHGLAAITPDALTAAASLRPGAHDVTDVLALVADAYTESLDWMQSICGAAYGAGPWSQGLRRCAVALVAALVDDPARARFCFLAVPTGCRALIVARDAGRRKLLRAFLTRVDADGPAGRPPRGHVEFVFGALRHLIEDRLRADRIDDLPVAVLAVIDLLDPLPPAGGREPALSR